MSHIRFAPFTDFEAFPAGLKVFSQLLSEPTGRTWVPAVDIKETPTELIFKADVPDVEMSDIDVHVENGALTIRGERKSEGKTEGWHRVERAYGKFERVFTLPETVDVDAVKADYKNGVLTISIAKKEIVKPKQIKVEVRAN